MIDGGTIEVIHHYLVSTGEQMRRTLIQTAFNPVIYEVLDFGISIYDADLQLIAEAPGLPDFLGANDYAIRRGVEHIGKGNLAPGDVAMLNYPYWSSAHTSDALLFAPVFVPHRSFPQAYLAVRAHWMDLGGKDASYILDSTDVHQEGIILPATKLVKKGQVDEEIMDILRFNSRMPDLIVGDFNAQLAAIRVGERRMLEIFEKFGLDVVEHAVARIIAHGEAMARDAVRALPDGRWSAEDWMDGDGISDDLIRLAVTVTIEGDRMIADYSDSSPMVRGPVNVPFGATQCMARTVFKSMTTPREPTNAGHIRPLEVIAPPGNIFHAVYPAPTFAMWTTFVALELIHKALAQTLDSVPAASGSDVPSFDITGVHPLRGELFSVSQNEGIGWGAMKEHDGANGLQHPSTSLLRNTSIEVLEQKAPILHERLELWMDSGGAGRRRGGLGTRRDVRATAPVEILSLKQKTRTRPWSLHGGKDAEPTAMVAWPGTPRERQVRVERFDLEPGEGFHHFAGGGGGYGDPLQREPARVVDDVLDGYVSVESAERDYGIIVAADGSWTPDARRGGQRSLDVDGEEDRDGER
jgi:N-methylhydantoinase B